MLKLLRLFGPYVAVVGGAYVVVTLSLIAAHALLSGVVDVGKNQARQCSRVDKVCFGSR
jgi:hypothetical protein